MRDVTYSRDLVSDLWGRTTVWDMVSWIHISTHLVSDSGGRRILLDMASWVFILTDLNVE